MINEIFDCIIMVKVISEVIGTFGQVEITKEDQSHLSLFY